MTKWKKQKHSVYQCLYHIVWCPKYRYRVLQCAVKEQLTESIKMLCSWKKIEIAEMNIQLDHVHIKLNIPPSYSILGIMGFLKMKAAIKIFKTYKGLRKNRTGVIIFGQGAIV